MTAAPPVPRRAAERHRSVTLPPRVSPSGPARPWRRSVFAASLVTLFALIPLLAAYGWSRALESGGGTTVADSTVGDPAAPGYEALVTPTTTLLLVQVAPDATLASVTLLAAGDAGGGGVLLIPDRLVVDADTPRPRTLSAVFAAEGATGVANAIRRSWHLGLESVEQVDDARWAALTAAVAPLHIDNTDELLRTGPGGEAEVAFPAGPLSLDAAAVGEYLRVSNEAEGAQAHLYRQELFWRAWLAALGEAPAGPAAPTPALPGETSSGIGLVVGQLAGPAAEVRTVPVTAVDSVAEPGLFDYRADAVGLAEVLAELVPFPSAGIPGDRVRARLLNGSGDQVGTLETATVLVPAGAEISIFGNADHFDYARTEVRYHDAARQPQAAALAAALGTDQVILDAREQEPVDVTIIIGADLAPSGVGQ